MRLFTAAHQSQVSPPGLNHVRGHAWTRQASGERGSTTYTRGSSGLSRSAGRTRSLPDRRSYSSSEAAPADDDCGGAAGLPSPDDAWKGREGVARWQAGVTSGVVTRLKLFCRPKRIVWLSQASVTPVSDGMLRPSHWCTCVNVNVYCSPPVSESTELPC